MFYVSSRRKGFNFVDLFGLIVHLCNTFMFQNVRSRRSFCHFLNNVKKRAKCFQKIVRTEPKWIRKSCKSLKELRLWFLSGTGRPCCPAADWGRRRSSAWWDRRPRESWEPRREDAAPPTESPPERKSWISLLFVRFSPDTGLSVVLGLVLSLCSLTLRLNFIWGGRHPLVHLHIKLSTHLFKTHYKPLAWVFCFSAPEVHRPEKHKSKFSATKHTVSALFLQQHR